MNLFLLATVVNVLLGWTKWVSLVVAAAIVLTYTALGGLSAAIYNEVLQFFVILAALVPLTIFGLIKVGGWSGLRDKVIPTAKADGTVTATAHEQLTTWPGQALSGFSSPSVGDWGRVRAGIRAVLRLLDDELRRGAARDGVEFDVGGTSRPDHRRVPEDVDPVRGGGARYDRRGRDRRHVHLKSTGSGKVTYNDAMLF